MEFEIGQDVETNQHAGPEFPEGVMGTVIDVIGLGPGRYAYEVEFPQYVGTLYADQLIRA